MYIKGSRATSRLVVRELNGERLNDPIVVNFRGGKAQVTKEIGQKLVKNIDGIEAVETKSSDDEDDD